MCSNILYIKKTYQIFKGIKVYPTFRIYFLRKKNKQHFGVSIKNTNFEQKSYYICYHGCIGNSTGIKFNFMCSWKVFEIGKGINRM